MHEASHAFALYLFKIKPSGLEIGFFGIKLKTPYIQDCNAKIIVSSFGPLASFLLFGLFSFGARFIIVPSCCAFFAMANFFIGFINLLPVYPLDGGAMLKTFLAKKLGIIRGARASKAVSAFFYVFLGGFNVCLAVNNVLNPSLIVIFIFALKCSQKEKMMSVMEKKMVLSGEILPGKKLKYIACDTSSDLLALASHISTDYTIIVAAFYNERFFGELSQCEIIDGIKKHGALCKIRDYIETTRPD